LCNGLLLQNGRLEIGYDCTIWHYGPKVRRRGWVAVGSNHPQDFITQNISKLPVLADLVRTSYISRVMGPKHGCPFVSLGVVASGLGHRCSRCGLSHEKEGKGGSALSGALGASRRRPCRSRGPSRHPPLRPRRRGPKGLGDRRGGPPVQLGGGGRAALPVLWSIYKNERCREKGEIEKKKHRLRANIFLVIARIFPVPRRCRQPVGPGPTSERPILM